MRGPKAIRVGVYIPLGGTIVRKVSSWLLSCVFGGTRGPRNYIRGKRAFGAHAPASVTFGPVQQASRLAVAERAASVCLSIFGGLFPADQWEPLVSTVFLVQWPSWCSGLLVPCCREAPRQKSRACLLHSRLDHSSSLGQDESARQALLTGLSRGDSGVGDLMGRRCPTTQEEPKASMTMRKGGMKHPDTNAIRFQHSRSKLSQPFSNFFCRPVRPRST